MIATLIAIAVAGATNGGPDTSLHRQWQACVDGAGKVDFTLCGDQYVRDADLMLNATWRQVRAAATGMPGTASALLDEQRAWIAYHQKACGFYRSQTDWGQLGMTYNYYECQGRDIERRTAELRSYAGFMTKK